MQVRHCISAAAMVLTCVAATNAGVVIRGASHAVTVNDTTGGSWANSNSTVSDESTSSRVKMKYVGDWSYALGRTAGDVDILTEAFLDLVVSNIPVRISNFQLAYGAKWVNGGGSFTVPETTIRAQYAVQEKLGATYDLESDPKIYLTTAFLEQLDGNGLLIMNGSTDAELFPSYILAASRPHYLRVQLYTSIDSNGFTSNFPSITVTNEYGGDLSGFAGFTAQFDWEAVPEPASAALMLACVAGLLLSRRRRG